MLLMHDSSFNFSWDFQQRCFPRDSLIVLCCTFFGGGANRKEQAGIINTNALAANL